MKTNKAFAISCFLILLTIVIVQMIGTVFNIEVVEKRLYGLPYEIDGYSGSDIGMEESVVKELDPDVYIFRNYTKGSDVITLYIGYYGTKKGGRSEHAPQGCYPGQGWTILAQDEVEIVTYNDGTARKMKINSLKVKKDSSRQLVYYWYQSVDKIFSSGIHQNIHRLKTRLFNKRNDGAFIRLAVPIGNKNEVASETLNRFFEKVYPLIVKYWPIEREP
jgi:EpsI family protein